MPERLYTRRTVCEWGIIGIVTGGILTYAGDRAIQATNQKISATPTQEPFK